MLLLYFLQVHFHLSRDLFLVANKFIFNLQFTRLKASHSEGEQQIPCHDAEESQDDITAIGAMRRYLSQT